MSAGLKLEVRRVVAASAARLFDAWTTPEQLLAWWGPRGVRCTEAEVDLRVGGRYRIANALPDGRVIVIEGSFLEVRRPTQLVYTWIIAPGSPERVTVRFEERGSSTEIIVLHEHIADPRDRDDHALGWDGCLDGLARLLADA